jgi:two-component system nitrate/nitrite response regulator NarL
MATAAPIVDRRCMVHAALIPAAAEGAAVRDTAPVARRVLVVDDHATFRSVARRLLLHAGYDVVGEAPDGARALALAGDLAPELVLLDVHLPDMSGFAVAERLAGTTTIVMTSTHDEPELDDIARSHGAWGFIPKGRLSPAGLAEAFPPA